MLGNNLEDAPGREATALAIGCSAFHRRDDLTPPLDLAGRHDARLAAIGALCVLGTPLAA